MRIFLSKREVEAIAAVIGNVAQGGIGVSGTIGTIFLLDIRKKLRTALGHVEYKQKEAATDGK